MGLLVWLRLGLVAGLLAKFIMPGQAPGGLLLTIVLGIVGALVGSGVGKDGIPAEWLAGLREWPRTIAWMEAVGIRLAQCRARGEIGSAVPVNPLKLLLRNVLFLVIVLLHGFRRLLPPY